MGALWTFLRQRPSKASVRAETCRSVIVAREPKTGMADVSFNDWKISHKLAAGFALMALVIAGTGAATFHNMGRLTAARSSYSKSQDAITLATQAGFLLARQENSFRGYLIGLDPYYLERADVHRVNFGKTLDQLEALLAQEPEKLTQLAAARTAAEAWYIQVVKGGTALAANPMTYQDATDMLSLIHI